MSAKAEIRVSTPHGGFTIDDVRDFLDEAIARGATGGTRVHLSTGTFGLPSGLHVHLSLAARSVRDRPDSSVADVPDSPEVDG